MRSSPFLSAVCAFVVHKIVVFGFTKFSAQVSAEQLSQPHQITPIVGTKQLRMAFGKVLLVLRVWLGHVFFSLRDI
jgi:hypothetical protein